MLKKIGIVSPANSFFRMFPGRVQNGILFFKSQGIDVVFAEHANCSPAFDEASILKRAEDLNRYIHDPEIDLIMAGIGGYNSNDILPYIDYDTISRTGKKIIGYSDITSVILAIYAKTGRIVYHGPTFLCEICECPKPYDYTWKSLITAIMEERIEYDAPEFLLGESIDWKIQEQQTALRPRVPHNGWVILQKGCAEGTIIGGNLSTIIKMIGSEYLPEEIFQDKILFVEHLDCSVKQFMSMLRGLEQRGIFQRIRGLIIGRILRLSEEGYPLEKTIATICPLGIPVIMDVDLGHTDPMLTIPIGGFARLDVNQRISFSIDKV